MIIFAVIFLFLICLYLGYSLWDLKKSAILLSKSSAWSLAAYEDMCKVILAQDKDIKELQAVVIKLSALIKDENIKFSEFSKVVADYIALSVQQIDSLFQRRDSSSLFDTKKKSDKNKPD